MSTKKLLSITNLKKYFPVAKSSIFQRKQLYVRANEDITIDIFEGETLGVVGESGCGKSTLGRVLLQLYTQTAGSTLYYGTTIEDMTPKYVLDTIRNVEKYRKLYQKENDMAADLKAKIDAAGGEDAADFYLLQDYNLAKSEAQTQLNRIARILGGFFASCDKDNSGKKALLRYYNVLEKQNQVKSKLKPLDVEISHLSDQETNKIKKKLKNLQKKKDSLEKQIQDFEVKVSQAKAELDHIRNSYAANEEFAKYEAMRDNGIDLALLTYNEMRILRKDIQIIFQDPYSSLNPRFTIGQIIEEGLATHNFFKAGSKKMQDHVLKTMEKCGLQDYMLHRYPHQFSGGQRQRISIARALAVNPKFIVCDECVSALDVSIQSQIINLLQELKEKENLTYMFISHDLSVVRYISDRICVMYLGNIVELADAGKIFDDPRHPYTVALLSSIPSTDMESLKKERILLEGNIPSPIKPPSGCKFHTRCYMACEKCKRVPPPLTEIEPGHFVACHFPQKKLDENGNYLFDLPKMEQKTEKN
ncbi:MAG: ATP-binding cassette domain-containing protein [Clostridia bacterium]|nr:ATP-binding cassette domain-containing protein [Clostridia bacterium]